MMGWSISTILLMGLASFRLTRLIVYDKITEKFRAPFFKEIKQKDETGKEAIYVIPKDKGISGWFGNLFSCYWCTGIWTSSGLILLYTFIPQVGTFVVLILGVAGIGSIIETFIGKLLGN